MKILVRPSHTRGSDVYHKPSEDDPTKPECNSNGPRERDWVEKDSSAFPNAELCRKCQGDYGKCGPEPGTESLASKLSSMDPSEV
jgi:hypothetical protein